MSAINIPEFPDDLLNQLHLHAMINGRDMSDELISIARQYLSRPLTGPEKVAIADKVRTRAPQLKLDEALLRRICNGGSS